ncbi:MAG: hypothetical protein QOF95_64, partial [Pseudonocardiales bacterium]|nr:hypothetical protein [Pseudonocardiales bacterium]
MPEVRGVDHTLMVKAVQAHAEVPWVVLSKNFWMSKSITQSLFQHRSRHT